MYSPVPIVIPIHAAKKIDEAVVSPLIKPLSYIMVPVPKKAIPLINCPASRI